MSNSAIIRIKVAVKAKSEKEHRIQKISPALGAKGVKPNEFLMKFDDLTRDAYKSGDELIVHLACELDNKGKVKNYKMHIGTLTVTAMIKAAFGEEKIKFKAPKYVDSSLVDSIVNAKKSSFYLIPESSIYKTVIGTMKSMNIFVKN